MAEAAPFRTRIAPWAGWITATAAVAINHQGLADAIYFNCAIGNPVSGGVLAVCTLALAWAGALISWRSRRDGEGPPAFGNRYFIAVIGVLLAAVYSVTIVFQALATLLIPACFR